MVRQIGCLPHQEDITLGAFFVKTVLILIVHPHLPPLGGNGAGWVFPHVGRNASAHERCIRAGTHASHTASREHCSRKLTMLRSVTATFFDASLRPGGIRPRLSSSPFAGTHFRTRFAPAACGRSSITTPPNDRDIEYLVVSKRL